MTMTTPHTYRLTTYPKDVPLRDGTQITLRPMTSKDAEPLLAFFRQIPEEDRYYLKEDVADAAVIRRWTAELDYERR